jgi:putative ABC transport system ATP-binding protein
MSKQILKINDLKKSFILGGGVEYKVLKGINLEMNAGEFYALMGPSGSGKSTLLNIVGALIESTSGHVLIDSKDLTTLNDNELTDIRRHKVAWIFQDFSLIPNLSALENVIIPMNLAGEIGPDVEERAIKLLTRVGLEERMNHLPDGMSGGQQQRVAIARALANRPKLLLADEPTGNLDTQTGHEIIELFKELAEDGTTILMVSHDVALAHSAQKVFILQDGTVEEEIQDLNGGKNNVN